MALRALARSYAQVVFSRSPLVGGVLLLATLLEPMVGVHGLFAAAVALGVAHLVGLRTEVIDEGLYGYNAVLAGLAAGALFEPSLRSVSLAAGAAAATVFVTAALRSLPQALPPLTVPFVLALWGLSLVSGTLPPAPAAGMAALGGLFFVSQPAGGWLVALALLLYSRQGAVLALIGVVVARLLPALIGLPAPVLLEVNLGLVALAVGGVWMVPSPRSVLLAAIAAATTGVAAYALEPMGFRLGLPVSVLPFNLAVWTVLLGLRQRAADHAPKAVDTAPGTPEQNLAYHQNRSERFGARYGVRFRAPVLGVWTVTQSEGDGPTHRDAWRHGLDLEVEGADGSLFRGEGGKTSDYHCYRLPVLATADGTVVAVVDGVRDNRIGEVELEDNWGNVVVLYHAPGLYSLVAHLAPGSIVVHEGQVVRQGDELGKVGSSGRSPHPHLHFQLQGSARVGAPTLPLELHDVVDASTNALRTTWSAPATGSKVRNLEVDPDLAEALQLRPGARWAFPTPIEVAVDVAGVPHLADPTGRVVFAEREDLLTFFAPLAPEGSQLHLFRTALARVPFEPGLSWVDHLPPLALVPWGLRPLAEIASMLVPWRGVAVTYRLEPDGRDWTVTGASEDGSVKTLARIDHDEGIVTLERTLRDRTRRIERNPTREETR